MGSRADWNRRYDEGSHPRPEPDPFLLACWERIIRPRYPGPAEALDVAGGSGRHALWLARQGWDVTLVDNSDLGIALARDRAVEAGVSLYAVVADLTRFVIVNRYALVLNFFYLERALFPALAFAVAPGGFLVFKTYTTAALELGHGPKDPAHLLHPGELREAFAASGLELLHYEEETEERGTAELLARRP